MKIVEALKRIKQNKEKVADLQQKISQNCANMSFETSPYGEEADAKIKEWVQSCTDLSQENVALLVRIARTNLATSATITIGDNAITKTLAEWIWRRREYAKADLQTWSLLGDRGLKDSLVNNSAGGEPTKIFVVRRFDPALRDKRVAEFKSEPHEIDSALEVVNAVTDLVE